MRDILFSASLDKLQIFKSELEDAELLMYQILLQAQLAIWAHAMPVVPGLALRRKPAIASPNQIRVSFG